MANAKIASLPTGWEACCFGDIAKIRNGYAFKSELFKKSREHETDVPLIRQSQMKGARIDTSDAVFLSGEHLKKHPDYVIAKGDVIIGMSGSIGKVCLYAEDFPALQNQRTGKIVPHLDSELNPKFFGLFLSNIERELTEYAKGMGVQNISTKDIEQLLFNLPPKNEQHRIVAKIEELFSDLDKGIENLKTARAQLKVYRQALLKHAFEGKLTARWRKENQDKLETADALLKRIQQARAQRYQQQLADWEAADKQGSKPKAPKHLPPLSAEELAELPALPKGWVWVKVGNVGSVGTGITPLKGRSDFYVNGYIPWVTSGALNNNFVTEASDYVTDLALKETNLRIYPKHTLLIALYGEGKTRGKCSELLIEATTNQAIAAIVQEGMSEKLRKYMKWFFQKNYGDIRLKSSGGVQPNLNLSIIENTLFPMCSIEEANQVVDAIETKLSEADQLELTITTSLQQAEALRQSILKKAFPANWYRKTRTTNPPRHCWCVLRRHGQ